jgi:hypothetical protein
LKALVARRDLPAGHVLAEDDLIAKRPGAGLRPNRIAEVLGTKNSIVDPANPKNFDEAQKGKVEFKQVSFRYPGAEKDTLEDITFTALPGQTTAIIGPTGSGKSTVANLVLRFYDASGGQVMVDGADVREVRQKDLRGRIGYVPQKGMLLSGSIASNLRYGRQDATDEEIEDWSPRRRSSSRKSRTDSNPRSPRAARTSPAGRNSDCPSPARWQRTRRSWCLTTAFPPWISGRTRRCGRR